MIYPSNYEEKVGFDEIRRLLREHCLSPLGKERVDSLIPLTDRPSVERLHRELWEFMRMMQTDDAPELSFFCDIREPLNRLRLEGTYMDEQELWDLRRSLSTIDSIAKAMNKPSPQDASQWQWPSLHGLAADIIGFPHLLRLIDKAIDKYGRMRDDASPRLSEIRLAISRTEGSISRTLHSILRSAQRDGLVDKDAAPTLRDGRLMIPVAPGLKRKINGIVHDESATGKTVFIEPQEVVEANNKIRELRADERREIISILKDIASQIRPSLGALSNSYRLMADTDLLVAKLSLADLLGAIEPSIADGPSIDFRQARHPLLVLAFSKAVESATVQERKVVPLDIELRADQRILIISGPNAGGKSVCLKTVGLLQYMVQTGLPIPVSEGSVAGIFTNIMIDIGDEQSIDDDLSTYSSHLTNMKSMLRHANPSTLLLIDEFGSGTEPKIGGAIAEAILRQLWQKGSYGVITTHYHNLKHFADSHDGVVNGAMLYDRHEMRALFQLAIGRPGSSFAIEIARKTGLPEQVIKDASDLVGSEYIQSDKYLQDIVRDKRYWEGKRQSIHQQEKILEEKISRYQLKSERLEASKREILEKAREEASRIISDANRLIENTIREIRESQAEKKATMKARRALKAKNEEKKTVSTKKKPLSTLTSGPTETDLASAIKSAMLGGNRKSSSGVRMVVDDRKRSFKGDLDLRGLRGDEALEALTRYIDDALVIGMPRVRILHGTGEGILRNIVRDYLSTLPYVSSFGDEDVRFGGAGITVVDLD